MILTSPVPCSLGFDEEITDGFYSVWGDFGAGPGIPSLADLQRVRPSPRDAREVLVFNHDGDPDLLALDERLSETMADLAPCTGPCAARV